jgi:hypothetical protein
MKKTIITTLVTLLFISCINMKDEHKYEWSPAVTALKEYPMEVYSGHLIIGETLKGAYGYLPFNTTINYGLDQSEETNDYLHYPPRFLDISWYSFTEKKTYSGIFELDYQLIDSILQKQSIGDPYYDEKEKKLMVAIYHWGLIKVGLLPGGVVRLWVRSKRGTYEVGRYQGKEDHTIDWKDVYPPEYTIQQAADSITKRLPQEIKDQIAQNRIPFGSWERLFNKYTITLKTEVSDKIENIRMYYANAEEEAIYFNGGGVVEDRKRAAPVKMYVEWRQEDGMRIEIETIFDQEKILDLYKTINPNEKFDFVIKINKMAKSDNERKGLISLENSEKKIDLSTCIKKQRTYKAYFQYPEGPPTFETIAVRKD